MKKVFYLLVFTLSCSTFGQNLLTNYEIGNYIDFNKQLINGYFDFDYEPEKSLNVSYMMGENFTDGYFYDKDGVKRNGLLKYSASARDLKFKYKNEDKERSIKPDECVGYVIGVDSICVIKNVEIQGVFGDSPSEHGEFAEFMEKVDGLTFYKFSAMGANATYVEYIVKKSDSSDYLNFPSASGKFIKLAVEIFGSDAVLKADIEKGKYKEKDIPSMIKIYKYRKLFANNQKIYLNSSWDETDNIKESIYYAKIESVQDSIFHLGYFFNNDVKIYEGNFTSFYPHKKRGIFVFYYPNGKMRKQVNYNGNKPKNVIEYFANGGIHRQYLYLEEDKIMYTQVNNEQGISIFSGDKRDGKESFKDAITGREIICEYKNQTLKNVYYTDMNGEKVYQLCEKNAKLDNFNKVQKLITDNLKYPKESVKKYNHGYALIKCIIENDGTISEAKLIKGIDVDCDVAINEFLSQFKSQIIWKPGKKDGVNLKQEIILPFDFSIVGFSAYKNHYNNFWMQNNMMMQQQMMMNQQWMNQQMMKIPTGRF